MLKQLTVLSVLLIAIHGKSIYDQRQDGRLNFHAQLDNIMIVIATPGDKGPSSLFNDIASQILELRGLTSRNKKVSVADEEILEEGKEPLSVKILRIEGNAPDHQQSAQSAIQSHRKLFEIPKIHDIKVHIDDSHLQKKEIPHGMEKKISLDNQQIIDKLGIAGKIHSQKSDVHPHKSEAHPHKNDAHSQKSDVHPHKSEAHPHKNDAHSQKSDVHPHKSDVHLHKSDVHSHENDEKKIHAKESEKLKPKDEIKPEKIEITENKESPKEKIPEKFISFGTISSIDGKVLYITDKKHTAANLDQLPEKQENHQIILLKENEPNSVQPGIPIETKIAEEKSKVDESLALKFHENQSDKSEIVAPIGKQIQTETADEKIIRKIRRIARQLRNSLKNPIHQKSRKSLKKELPRFDDHKVDEAGDKNEVRLIADQKAQFLKPVGEMIENCGPGRVRNRYGICQFDESFN